MTYLFSIFGYAGSLLLLLGYYQISRGQWHARSFRYQGCNAVGAALLSAYAIYLEAYPNLVLNGVFLGIALVTISKLKSRQL